MPLNKLLKNYYHRKTPLSADEKIQGTSTGEPQQTNMNSSNSNPYTHRTMSDSRSNSITTNVESQYSNCYESWSPQAIKNLPISAYEEDIITSKDYLKNITKDPLHRSASYCKDLFPIFKWIGHYPFEPKWIVSDFITGVSVSIVLVPQAMSYAKLATLTPEYGLYSSFIGLIMYAFFATSKDVSIGPVAVMSMEVSKIIARIQDKYGDAYTAPEIATTLALLCGAITLGVGLLRLGFLVELIPLPAVMAFTTGSAFSIITGQLPGLMGYSQEVNTREASYKVMINFLKHLPDTKVDAAFGLVGLFILYVWKYTAQYLSDRYPKRKLMFAYLQNLRTAIVIIFSTLISFLIIRHHRDDTHPFKITGEIKPGLRDVGMFTPPANLAAKLAPDLPVATIVLVLEHISIAKSFGRINDYKIDPNQEFIAIGVTNMIGTFFHAYPATGSFSRTALAAKCGVRTPFASIFAGFCVLIAIYCFTDAFYYIPNATLCAIIIHAVSDLLASYAATWKLFLVQPLDCGIFLVGVFVAVFSSIENGIYWAMCASAALIFWRMCITNGTFMGRIKVAELINPIINEDKDNELKEGNKAFVNSGLVSLDDSLVSGKLNCNESTKSVPKPYVSYQYRWVPMSNNQSNPSTIHTRYINKSVSVESPPPGVIVYRMSESFVYPNCSAQTDKIIDEIKKTTRTNNKNTQKVWNDPGKLNINSKNFKINFNLKYLLQKKKKNDEMNSDDLDNNEMHSLESQETNNERVEKEELLPKLKLVHLDFSQVVAIDATSIQALTDMKRAIELYVGADFQIHFSGIINPWVIRGLVNAGFGGKIKDDKVEDHEIEVDIEEENFQHEEDEEINNDLEKAIKVDNYIDAGYGDGGLSPLFGTNLPFFHFDIPSYIEFDS